MKPLALIGLVGKKHSGKDSVYQQLDKAASEYKLRGVPIRFSFGDEIKKEVAHMLGTDLTHIEINKELLRGVLQEHGRSKYDLDKEYWLKKLVDFWNTKDFLYPAFIVVTDVRRQNEASLIHSYGGKLIRIRRKLTDDSGDLHVTETELEHIKCDNFIYNDEGKERLRFMAIDVLKQLFGGLLA